jgi:hypothetical protein
MSWNPIRAIAFYICKSSSISVSPQCNWINLNIKSLENCIISCLNPFRNWWQRANNREESVLPCLDISINYRKNCSLVTTPVPFTTCVLNGMAKSTIRSLRSCMNIISWSMNENRSWEDQVSGKAMPWHEISIRFRSCRYKYSISFITFSRDQFRFQFISTISHKRHIDEHSHLISLINFHLTSPDWLTPSCCLFA